MTPRVIFSGVPLPVCDRCDATASRYVDVGGRDNYAMLCADCSDHLPSVPLEYTPPPSEFAEYVSKMAFRRMRAIDRHRERYVSAWYAQTGIDPRDAMLVEQDHADGRKTLTIERADRAPRERRDTVEMEVKR